MPRTVTATRAPHSSCVTWNTPEQARRTETPEARSARSAPAPAYSRSNARCGIGGFAADPAAPSALLPAWSYPSDAACASLVFTRSANANTLSMNCSRRPSSNASASDPNTQNPAPATRSPSPSASAALSARHACPALMRATVARDASKARPVKFKGGSNVTRLFPVVPVPLTVPTACRRLMSGASEPTTPRTSTMSPRAKGCTRRVRSCASAERVIPLYCAQSQVCPSELYSTQSLSAAPSPCALRSVHPPSCTCSGSASEPSPPRFGGDDLSGDRSSFFQNVFFSPNPPPMKRATPSAAPGSKWSPVRSASVGAPATTTASEKVTKKYTWSPPSYA